MLHKYLTIWRLYEINVISSFTDTCGCYVFSI